jgi:DNA-binding SARP family transcriptional activator
MICSRRNAHAANSLEVAWDSGPVAMIVAAARAVTQQTFLPGCVGVWVEDWQRRLGLELVRALEVECEAALRCKRYASAVRAAEHAVTLDPFRDSAQVLLVRAASAAGDPAAAQRAYHRYRAVLRRELGMAPSSALTDAYLRVIQAESAIGHRSLRETA